MACCVAVKLGQLMERHRRHDVMLHVIGQGNRAAPWRQMTGYGYEETLERLSVRVRSPPESRPSDRAIQQVGNQCLVPATKRTMDVKRVYARL